MIKEFQTQFSSFSIPQLWLLLSFSLLRSTTWLWVPLFSMPMNGLRKLRGRRALGEMSYIVNRSRSWVVLTYPRNKLKTYKLWLGPATFAFLNNSFMWTLKASKLISSKKPFLLNLNKGWQLGLQGLSVLFELGSKNNNFLWFFNFLLYLLPHVQNGLLKINLINEKSLKFLFF